MTRARSSGARARFVGRSLVIGIACWLPLAIGSTASIEARGASPPPASTGAQAIEGGPRPCEEPIQDLVDRALPGSTVTLPACTSDEELRVKHPLVIEASGTLIDGMDVLAHAVVVEADDVTIIGLSVRRVANAPQDGAIRAWDVDRFVFRDGTVEDSAGACISIARGADALIADSRLARCEQEGIHATRADRLMVRGNRIHENNAARSFNPEWEAGGAKVTRSTGVVFEQNEVWGNGGPGIWCDLACQSLVVRGNRVWANDRAGIHVEISDGATVERNAVWENGWVKPSWGWGAGILVSSSSAVAVRSNVVAWNADGIVVVSQSRDDAPAPIRDVRTADNLVAATAAREAFGVAWLQDWPGTLFDPAAQNGGSADRFWFDRPEDRDVRFAWAGSYRHLEEFIATPGGQGGSYVDDAEMTAELAAAGIPAAPRGMHAPASPTWRDIAPAALIVTGAVAVGLATIGILFRRRRHARAANGSPPPP